MPLYSDVITRIDERAAKATADQLEEQFAKAGNDAGAAFSKGTSAIPAEMQKVGREASSTFRTELNAGIGNALSGATSQLGSFGRVADSTLKAIPVSAAAAAVGIVAIGAGAVVAGKALYDLGAQWDSIADGITVRTGKVGADLTNLTDVVRDVGSSTAASIGSIGDIVGQISQSMPDLAQNNAAVRQMASNLAYLDANGQTVNIRELGRAFSAFNVPVSDQVKTLDDLNNVSQATGIPINQLIQTVQSGAPQFKQFGLDVGGATALVASFEDAGISSGPALTGLRTALQNVGNDARGAAPALADAVTQIKALHDAGQEGGAMKLAQDTFGTENFAPFLDAIENGRLGVDDLKKALTDLGLSLKDQQKETEDGSGAWQRFTNRLSSVFQPVANNVSDSLDRWTFLLGGATDQLEEFASVPIDPKSALGQILTSGGVAIPGTGGPGVGVVRPQGIGSGVIPAPGGGGGLMGPNGLLAPTWGSHSVSGPSGAGGGAAKSAGAPGVPYDTSLPPGIAGLPQTAELYSAESSFLDARHSAAEKQAKLNQLLRDNTATEDQITNARADVAQAQRNQTEAELRLYDTQNKQITKQTSQLNEFGAQLDSDFGISKGLAGIAENITKFVANLAVAPWEKQMNDIANAPGQAQGGYGLLGMLGAQGAFGPQYTAAGQTAAGGNGVSGLGPAALQPNGAVGYMGAPGAAYPGDQALLANVPAGRYGREFGGDLTKGLGDCSSAIEDLVNLMDGRPTSGASMATGNEAEWLQARGFLPGMGGPGDFRVGFNSGHTQATLPGGTPFNWGSDAAAARGGVGGTGADDPAFTSHYYRPGGGAPAAAPSVDPFAALNTDPGLTNPPAPTAPGLPPGIIGGAGEGPIFGAGPSLGVGGGATPGGPGIPFGGGASPGGVGGPGAGPTRIGGGAGLEGSGKGGVGLSDGAMGMLTTAMGGLDLLMPGAGQAAQTATKLANRAIQFGGQGVGIGVQGAIDTFVPFGGSKLASSNWATRLIGGLAGAHPTLPNTAGPKQGQMTPDQAAAAGGAPGGQQAPPPPAGNTFNTTITGKDASDDSVAREAAFHWGASNQGPGM